MHLLRFLPPLENFFRDEEGGTLIEYAFLASLIGIAAVGGMTALGNTLSVKFESFNTALN